MVLVRLRRRAPEVDAVERCSLCGKDDVASVGDHLLVGEPGSAQLDGGLCGTCGDVLDHLVQRFGSQFSVVVEDAADDHLLDKVSVRPMPADIADTGDRPPYMGQSRSLGQVSQA